MFQNWQGFKQTMRMMSRCLVVTANCTRFDSGEHIHASVARYSSVGLIPRSDCDYSVVHRDGDPQSLGHRCNYQDGGCLIHLWITKRGK